MKRPFAHVIEEKATSRDKVNKNLGENGTHDLSVSSTQPRARKKGSRLCLIMIIMPGYSSLTKKLIEVYICEITNHVIIDDSLGEHLNVQKVNISMSYCGSWQSPTREPILCVSFLGTSLSSQSWFIDVDALVVVYYFIWLEYHSRRQSPLFLLVTWSAKRKDLVSPKSSFFFFYWLIKIVCAKQIKIAQFEILKFSPKQTTSSRGSGE